MGELGVQHDRPDADEQLRRLEARVVAGDLALQRQTETLLAAAAGRAERTAAWAIVGLAGASALFVLDLWIARRSASKHRGAYRPRDAEMPPGRTSAPSDRQPAARMSRLVWPLAATGTLWRAVPTLRAVWRMLPTLGAVFRVISEVASGFSRTGRRR